jgi:hypothetical protein
MLKRLAPLLACFAFGSHLSAQMLIVDRIPSSIPHQMVGLTKETNAFLADDFQAGAATEDWVIDHIRLWAVPDPKAIPHHRPGDLFRKISFYGGIAPDPPLPGQRAGPDCDCHNLPALKTAVLEPGGVATGNPDVVLASTWQDGTEVWQIDFEDLRWSVPGATSIQFGVLAEGGREHGPDARYNWYYLASPASEGEHLRVFSSVGKLLSSFQEGGGARLNIQAWGHLLAKVSIRPAGQKLQVILRGQTFLDAAKVDPASLRFGPRSAAPANARAEDVDQDGNLDLVMYFRASDAGIPPGSVNACLRGRRLDGAPFEGCDLLAH